MKKADSIVIRLTGMVFILIFLTTAILLILVNNQMARILRILQIAIRSIVPDIVAPQALCLHG